MLILSYQPGHGKERVSIRTFVRGNVIVWMKTLSLIFVACVCKLRHKQVQLRWNKGHMVENESHAEDIRSPNIDRQEIALHLSRCATELDGS
jgi:hypothetical protein